MSSKYLFQYCQKLVILSNDKHAVLLARRDNETEFDGVFSFIGGKMEITDSSLIDGMKREKDEEIGQDVVVKILPNETFNKYFVKKDGSCMVLPHIPGYFKSGEIKLSKEYSELKWVPLADLEHFEPKIDGINEIALWAATKVYVANESEFEEI